jgi:hypothetical protein
VRRRRGLRARAADRFVVKGISEREVQADIAIAAAAGGVG